MSSGSVATALDVEEGVAYLDRQVSRRSSVTPS